MSDPFLALQAALPADNADREGLRDTLGELQKLTVGNPAYAKYHAHYATSLWEACQTARCEASLHASVTALLCRQYDMMQVGPKRMQGCAEQMQTVVSQSDCAATHYSLSQATRHL